ncbi:MAG: hypothetical protein L0H53_08490 [Candidatus Nitrosocosmicus sp.]|nr:hypothetical protein [Candidatus Nitrosocosmicus sp.]MDN5868537.1 hypothetical protein [Candidatus Nitrosocosmicus sp.]
MTKPTSELETFNLLDLIRCPYQTLGKYIILEATPATGILYLTDNSPNFISGHIRLRGKYEGRYPYKYLDMIENIFGPEPNTIEVCSRSVMARHNGGNCFTVDINKDTDPDLVTDAMTLEGVSNCEYDRWRADPPYNESTAMSMYDTALPSTAKLLETGARICKPKSLLFLLLGPQNYQHCPRNLKRIGWICITIVPNNELRALHIFYKNE